MRWFSTNIRERLTNPYVDFSITFHEKHTNPNSFLEECDNVARSIRIQSHHPFVGLSGGIDSEAVCEILLRNGVRFTPIIVVHEANAEELNYAFEYVKRRDLNPYVYHVDDKELADVLFHDIHRKLNGPGINSSWSIIAARVASHLGNVFITGDHFMADEEPIQGHTFRISEWEYYVDAVVPTVEFIPFFQATSNVAYASLIEAQTYPGTWLEYKADKFRIPKRPKSRARYTGDIGYLIRMLSQLRSAKNTPKYDVEIPNLPDII